MTNNTWLEMAGRKIAAWILCCCSFAMGAAPKLVHYPAITNSDDARSEYQIALLA